MDVIVLAIVTCGPQVLIIRRVQTSPDVPNLVWAFPGGKVEDGETLEQAVIREVAEETGLHIARVHLLHARIIPHTKRLALYYHCPLASNVLPDPAISQREVSVATWVSGPEALSIFTSDVVPLIAAFLKQRDFRCCLCASTQ